ncbi:hypothetical protein ACJMK2_006447, partial [Sinanodonta woodiana]
MGVDTDQHTKISTTRNYTLDVQANESKVIYISKLHSGGSDGSSENCQQQQPTLMVSRKMKEIVSTSAKQDL